MKPTRAQMMRTLRAHVGEGASEPADRPEDDFRSEAVAEEAHLSHDFAAHPLTAHAPVHDRVVLRAGHAIVEIHVDTATSGIDFRWRATTDGIEAGATLWCRFLRARRHDTWFELGVIRRRENRHRVGADALGFNPLETDYDGRFHVEPPKKEQ